MGQSLHTDRYIFCFDMGEFIKGTLLVFTSQKLIFVYVLPDRGRKDLQYGGNMLIMHIKSNNALYSASSAVLFFNFFPPQGPSIIESDEKQKGLLPRVVDGIYNAVRPSDGITKCAIKLSMV